jgi:primosomal protein N' (replication factor Y)
MQRKKHLNKGVLSSPLRKATHEALSNGNQVLMFQNRRGFAPMVQCGECGWTPKCVNCDVSLVYHKNTRQLRCHYCGYSIALPTLCPACGLNGINTFGYGTERIAEEVHNEYSDYKVARMDLDTTRNKDAYQDIIEKFAAHQTDLLVGTQMISKGLDFAKVKVVGVINADTLLNFPDFRSEERAFNMLEQVSGRAGRKGEKGKVIIQTTNPDEKVLAYVKAHDYDSYYAAQIEDRRRYAYPPFTKVINIYLKHRDSSTVDMMAVAYSNALRQTFGNRVLGPEKPAVGRVATFYLQTIMLKIEANASMKKVKSLLRIIYEKMAAEPRMKGVVVYYDVDPV